MVYHYLPENMVKYISLLFEIRAYLHLKSELRSGTYCLEIAQGFHQNKDTQKGINKNMAYCQHFI